MAGEPTSERTWCSQHECHPVQCSVLHSVVPFITEKIVYICPTCQSEWSTRPVAIAHAIGCTGKRG